MTVYFSSLLMREKSVEDVPVPGTTTSLVCHSKFRMPDHWIRPLDKTTTLGEAWWFCLGLVTNKIMAKRAWVGDMHCGPQFADDMRRTGPIELYLGNY